MIDDNRKNNFGLNFENIISSMQDDNKNADLQNNLKKNENLENNDFHKNIFSINLEELEESINNREVMSAVQDKSKNSADKVINFHKGHRQRARERFLANPDGITDRDLLELMLFWIIPRADVVPIVYALMDRFGTINNIYKASIDDINSCGVNGMALKYIFAMVHIINKRILEQKIDKFTLDTIDEMVPYCRSLFTNFQEEECFIIFLDNKLKLIYSKPIGVNNVNNISFSTKSIIKDAIASHSVNVVLTHNHPSNDITPSQNDLETTRELKQCLSTIDVKLIEHIIIGTTNYYSFAENNLL